MPSWIKWKDSKVCVRQLHLMKITVEVTWFLWPSSSKSCLAKSQCQGRTYCDHSDWKSSSLSCFPPTAQQLDFHPPCHTICWQKAGWGAGRATTWEWGHLNLLKAGQNILPCTVIKHEGRKTWEVGLFPFFFKRTSLLPCGALNILRSNLEISKSRMSLILQLTNLDNR